MECSAIDPCLRSLGLQLQCFQSLTGPLTFLELTGLRVTPPQDIASVKELWTPQALAMKRERAVSASDISKCEETLKGSWKEKVSAEFARMCSTQASSSRRLAPHMPGNPCGTRPATIDTKTGTSCTRGRISIFFKDFASVDVDHTEIIYMKACCGCACAGPTPLRINFCECILVAVVALGTGEF